MPLGLSLTTFSPSTTMQSSQVNSNFSAINSLSSLPIPFLSFSSDGGILQSNGGGDMLWNGGIGKSTYTDVVDGRGNTTIINDPSNTNGIVLLINGTNRAQVNSTSGWLMPSGSKLSLLTGSLARLSIFSGTGNGTFSHGNGGTPTWIIPMQNSGANNNVITYDTLGSTTVHIDNNNNPPWWALALAQ
jgi:hypothetical protein